MTTLNTGYTVFGNMIVVPQADLEDLQSAANRKGDTRRGGDSIGKKAGKKVIVSLTSGGTYKEVIALGALSSDAWRVVDGSANHTPVNFSTWTTAAGCTYAAGLLTADGTDNPTTSQVIALKAGTYKISCQAAGEGTYGTDYHTPKITVTGATDGALITKTFNTASDVTVSAATGAENATKSLYANTFTLTVAQNVTIAASIVDESGALEAGSGYIAFSVLESA